MREFTQHKYSATTLEKINEFVTQDPARFVRACEEGYASQISALVDRVSRSERNIKLILLSGPSASAKTTTAYNIRDEFARRGGRAEVVSLDNFYMGKGMYPLLPNGKEDFESIYALDIAQLHSCLNELFETGAADFPIFDFKTSSRMNEVNHITLSDSEILIIEGIHALNPILTHALPMNRIFKLYVSVRTKIMDGETEILSPKEMRLVRRMVRDYNFRAYPAERTFSIWENICRGEREYINPYRDTAEFKIDTMLEYEPCVFHHYIQPFLKMTKPTDPCYSFLMDLWRKYEYFIDLRREDIPARSLLREFIQD